MSTPPAELAMTPAAPPFRERLRRARSKRNEDWWSIVFGGPIAQVLTALTAELAWITPNRLTWLSFLAKLAAAPLILQGSPGATLAAILLLQANVVLDCMDGILARYRKASSVLGAFLDKVTDAIGLLAVMGAFGLRTYRETGDGWAFAVVLAGVGLWQARVYAWWVLAYFEKQAGMPKPTSGGEPRADFGDLDLGGRLAYYAASTWRIVMLSEADAFFWLGLALATGWLQPIAYLYGGGLVLWSIGMLTQRALRAAAVDTWARQARGTR
jgi:phosphatidylglycerophosphate synthase